MLPLIMLVNMKIQKTKGVLQVLNVYSSNGKTSITTTALLGSGSDSTLISSVLADKLNPQCKTKGILLTNASPMSSKMKPKLVNFSISSCSHSQHQKIKKVWVVQNLQLSTSPVTASSDKQKYSHLICLLDWGRPNLTSRWCPNLTSRGRPEMMSRGRPNLTFNRRPWEVDLGRPLEDLQSTQTWMFQQFL